MLDFAIDVSPEFVPVLSIQAVDVGAIEIRKKRHSSKAECPLDRSSADLPQNLRPLPAPLGNAPFCVGRGPAVPPSRWRPETSERSPTCLLAAPRRSHCNAKRVLSVLAKLREDRKVRFDLNSPEGRLAALEVLGVIRYNEELAKTTSREMVVATAPGHEIVTAHSP